MRRVRERHVLQYRRSSTFVAAAFLFGAFAFASAAAASPAPTEAASFAGIVLAEGSSRCEDVHSPVDAAPPARVTIKADGVDFDCSGGTSLRFSADAAFAFDDAKGTATALKVRIAATRQRITCTYEAARVTLEREGTMREYAGGPINGKKVGGSWLCPRSVNLDSTAITFHQ